MITVIGSINLDLIATVPRLPHPGETVPGNAFRSAPGGKGANQALAAARAGAPTRMVGAVGRDAFASEALALLKIGGVGLAAVRETDEPTGTALILVEASGENMIAVVPGANGTVGDDVAGELKIAAGDHLLLQHEIPLDTVEAALDAAREAGAVSLLNTAPFRPEAVPFLAKADYVIANETEFDLCADELSLDGETREERMQDFARKTSHVIVVTLGGNGVIAAKGKELLTVDALPVTPIDTVGAGDTFCGYMAAALANGTDLESALRLAAVAGSLACLTPGAQPSIPIKSDVEAAL